MSSRDLVLGRIRSALADRPAPEPVAWTHGRPTPLDDDRLTVFCERVADYQATVQRCAPDETADLVAAALSAAGAGTVVLPPGLPRALAEAAGRAAEVVPDPGSAEGLDGIAAVVTACAVGIAVTGTIVLDHAADQGRRALTLVPDVHVCVVRADQVVSDVPEAVARLSEAAAARRPMTWISGPSATSDIELSRVEGVHGPRTLHVIVVED